ncbi:redox-regulated ATPase YchF [Kosmotoga pacifica]|uniref:GTP-binding protein n=1 Tax=Kosmotoga pacifica TaxID=1330330 RepID=A0A0G2Z9M0_9BACT|nr:redox-regulated ATPase YchF [Kosmotoga pacifica]AKI96791.1 GTP-binding protein [Kosmotoga pacifica]
MEIGIFGLPMSGKSTIFSLLTGTSLEERVHKSEAYTGVAKIHDERVERLSEIFNPRKMIYATLSFVDIPGFDLSANRKEKNRVFQFIQNSDALLAVVRAFEDPSVPWPVGAETPTKQLELIKSELLLRDLEVVENRLNRLEENSKKKKLTPEELKEKEILQRVIEVLEEEQFVSRAELSEEELKLLGSLSLFTAKPIIVVANLDESQFSAGDYSDREKLIESCKSEGFAYIELSGKIEQELNALQPEDRELFMEELGIEESGIQRLSQVVYAHVGLISFLTVGEDEVRAWTVHRGATALDCAAKIHTDLAKKFIKAEVISYEDFMLAGSMHEAKTKGLLRLVGKDERINDGDIVHIRANA